MDILIKPIKKNETNKKKHIILEQARCVEKVKRLTFLNTLFSK